MTKSKVSQHTTSRTTTILRDLVRDYGNTLEANVNPDYDDAADAKYTQIFGVSRKQCFITFKNVNPVGGDHLYAVRGYYRYTQRYGFDSMWNRINTYYSDTQDYKIFKVVDSQGRVLVQKDIGYEELTEDELLYFPEKKQEIYWKVARWKAYLRHRKVQLSYHIPDDLNTQIIKVVHDSLNQLQQSVVQLITEKHAKQSKQLLYNTAKSHRNKKHIHKSLNQPTPTVQPTQLLSAHSSLRLSNSHNLPKYDPSQWRVEVITRQSGASIGKTYKYYYHKEDGIKCRSKVGAQRHQQLRLQAFPPAE